VAAGLFFAFIPAWPYSSLVEQTNGNCPLSRVENQRRFTQSETVKLCAVVMAVVSVALCAGCNEGKRSQESKPEMTSPVIPGEPTAAQPKLQTIKLWLGAEELITELALNPQQTRTGMMFRTKMAENEAMLFVFGRPHQASFWMKNVDLPLSAAYIGPEGDILEIHDLQPQNTNSVTAASERVQYVLETPQGWFKRHNLGPGTVVRTERGSLAETFFRK
jgi:uncharacterized protein